MIIFSNKCKFFFYHSAILLLTLLAGCASKIQNYESKEDVKAETITTSKLWAQSEDFERALLKSDKVYRDDEAKAYLQEIINRLFPEYVGKLRIHIYDSITPNAFALPNGSIYINMGLLSALSNEVHLATVLAHEGVHFTHRHGEKSYNTFHSAVGFGNFVAAMGIPLLGQFTALGVISSYSKAHETEADEEGFWRLKAAGYDIREATEAFKQLQKEAKALEQKNSSLFSSHPKLSLRIANFESLIDDSSDYSPSLPSNFEKYNKIFSKIRPSVLERKLQTGHYAVVIALLQDESDRALYGGSALYYLAQAYRLRAFEGDLNIAEQLLKKQLEQSPSHARTYLALGEINYKKLNFREAKGYFMDYLSLGEIGQKKSFVEFYLNKIEEACQEDENC